MQFICRGQAKCFFETKCFFDTHEKAVLAPKEILKPSWRRQNGVWGQSLRSQSLGGVLQGR